MTEQHSQWKRKENQDKNYIKQLDVIIYVMVFCATKECQFELQGTAV